MNAPKRGETARVLDQCIARLDRILTLSDYDKSLIAHPVNSELSTEPNKSQTIINVIRVEGPMTKDQLIARMQELLGSERAAKYKILSLVQQLTMGHPARLEWDDETDSLKVTP